MRKKVFLLYVIIITVLYALFWWINSIPLNIFLSDGLMFFVSYCVFIGIGLIVKQSAISFTNVFTGNRVAFSLKQYKLPCFIIGIPVIFVIILSIAGAPIFHVDACKNQIGTIETKEFNEEMQAIDVAQLPVVDLELASKLAEKKLGEKPALGSQVTLGEPTIQNVAGKLMWVVPLEHSGFFKWMNNLEGTPGYITVSATDQKEVTYVDSYKIKYQPSSYLAQNLKRHVRFGKGLTSGLTDYSFEIDDSGKPYWVITTYRNTRCLNLPEATGVIVVDTQTGNQEKYGLDNLPQWIDRVQPRTFINNQINNRGEYINGIFNFSNKDKFKTSNGSAVVYNNGNCYMFTGITSVGSDDASTGFMMVDLKTKKTMLYNIGGATEEAAQKSAEGKVQNLRYEATFPIVTNINGTPTYFMTLKDKEGLIKQYAFVSIKDYNMVGTGETVNDALKQYEQIIRRDGNVDINTKSNIIELEGSIDRISYDVINGSSTYRIILKEKPDLLFNANYDISSELAITEKNDKVKITYYETDKKVIDCKSFDNLQYEQ